MYMRKVLLVTFCCIFSLTALSASSQEEDSDEYFQHEDAIYQYQTQAYDILHTFQDNTWIPAEHIQAIQLIINRLNNQPSPQALKPIHQVLRCYQALALLCDEKNKRTKTPTKKQLALSELLMKRAAIITKIARAAYPAALAALVNYNLGTYLGRQPTPEELARFKEQERSLIQKRNTELEQLNQELFVVEKKILKDPRNQFTKYATTILAITGVIALTLAAIRTIDLLRPRRTHNNHLTLKA